MKAIAVAALALLQVAMASSPEPKHLRYERAVNVPAGASGTACAVLDATVFAHSESRSANDVRLFEASGAEVPFAVTENAPQPDAAVDATVQNLGERDGAVVFDLVMPTRAYSEVDLQVEAKDFVAIAEVTDAATGTKLGTFTLFDLTKQRLSRSTALMLQEATFPRLHVVLRNADGRGKTAVFPTSAVRGASVPASRETQGIYTAVARTEAITQRGRDSVAVFDVPAHVPVERVRVELADGFAANFVRGVSVAEGTEPAADAGEISRTKMKLVSAPGAPPINAERLWVDAVLAGNLRAAERVTVLVHNGDDKPLPMRAVMLEMRQRKICFAAAAGASYVLRYGDAALGAPVYDYARMFDSGVPAAEASLGAEQVNASYAARTDVRSYTERHPELIWVALIAVVAVLGATAVSSAKHGGRG